MPSCIACRTSASSAAPRIRANWWSAPTKLGYCALAITDECSVAGVVRAYAALQGPEAACRRSVQADPGQRIPLRRFPAGGAGAQRDRLGQPVRIHHGGPARSEKGRVHRQPRATAISACWTNARSWWRPCATARMPSMPRMTPAAAGDRRLGQRAVRRRRLAGGRTAAGPGRRAVAATRCSAWAPRTGVPLVAAGDVHMHVRSRKALQDVITAVREGKTGGRMRPGLAGQCRALPAPACAAGRHLSAANCWRTRWYVAARCNFSLESIKYQYPLETVPPGMTPAQALRRFTIEGARQALSEGRALEGAPAAGARAAADRRLPLRDVLPHGARHRALCARAEDPVPGPRLGGQLRRLLLPARDRGGPGARQPAVRALHQQGAQGAARHRRRLRARAARGGHPVHLRQVRPRPRRHRRRGRQLPHAQRHPRRRQGAGHSAGAGRCLRQGALLVRRRGPAGAAAVRARRRSRRGDRRAAHAAVAGADARRCAAFRAT